MSLHLSSASNVYCTGGESCLSSILEDNHNVYIYSHQGGLGISIEYSENVYCSGTAACQAATIANIENIVHGNGFEALMESVIENIRNSVIS